MSPFRIDSSFLQYLLFTERAPASVIWQEVSNNKILIAEGLSQFSAELRVAQATAEVYRIDCLVAGGNQDHKVINK